MSELTRRGLTALIAAAVATPALARQTTLSLPSWNDSPAQRAIVDFVNRVTAPGPDFVSPERRIAVFDNDGTLWCEQPMYVEGLFLGDRIAALVEANPELKTQEPYRTILAKDPAALGKLTQQDLVRLIDDTHAGMTTDAFAEVARQWIDTVRDRRFNRLHRELIYQPQLELLAFLRARDFSTFIVSGGGVDFMRTFAERAYNIPPQQVIGSSGKAAYRLDGDVGTIVKQPGIGSIDDKGGKPVNIQLHIGRRPILAFGNSDGDLEMLQYTTTGDGPRLGLLVHHDDAAREYAYDRRSAVGALDKALDEAPRRGWQVVSMRNDWKRIFPFDPAPA